MKVRADWKGNLLLISVDPICKREQPELTVLGQLFERCRPDRLSDMGPLVAPCEIDMPVHVIC